MNELPLAGRRLYFVGIGGGGPCAYPNFSRVRGAGVWWFCAANAPSGPPVRPPVAPGCASRNAV